MGKIEEGDFLGNRFEVLKVLGGKKSSQRGVVLLCHDTQKKEIIVLKTLQDKFSKKERVVNCFKREALAWIHLGKHPHIVRAKYVINIEDRQFLALEYIAPDENGRNTLTDYLSKPLSLEETLNWAIQFCIGMEYALSRGISPHRDIKPDNIMITENKLLKITDYGLAKFLDDAEKEGLLEDFEDFEEEEDMEITFTPKTAPRCVDTGGSAAWMPPEQFDGIADIRSDIYAFGIVLFQMVNKGALPFMIDHYEIWQNVHKTKPVPKIDSKLFPIIEKCLNKKPENRYQNFKQLRNDLQTLYKEVTGEEVEILLGEQESHYWEHYDKGKSLHMLGYPEEAIKEYKKALEIDPNHVETYIGLGISHSKSNRFDNAIECFQKALKMDPHSFEANFRLAKTLLRKGDHSEALRLFEQVLQMKPTYFAAHYFLGKTYEAMKDYTNALAVYKNFLQSVPKKAKYEKYAQKSKQKISEIKKTIKVS